LPSSPSRIPPCSRSVAAPSIATSVGAVIVHPDFSDEVFPLAPEPIQLQDGATRNDCERNAARRWLKQFRQEHPHLRIIVTEGRQRAASGGRVRWRIENETFNTLKNQGYHFDHNYGHGSEYLAVVFAFPMMLVFLIDQIQQRSNDLFQKALTKKERKCALWESMRHLFAAFEVASMREVYEAMAYGHERPRLKPLVDTVGAGTGPSVSNSS
jgi:hypothetical protein